MTEKVAPDQTDLPVDLSNVPDRREGYALRIRLR
jgi:hypothetical protein